jgi:hypothetical protein
MGASTTNLKSDPSRCLLKIQIDAATADAQAFPQRDPELLAQRDPFLELLVSITLPVDGVT